jgi:hypothetical protein
MQEVQGNYSTWLYKPVLLHIATEGFLTALMCMIVSESDATLRIRVTDLWDFDIYKEMVLAVEPAFRAEKLFDSRRSLENELNPSGHLAISL